MKMMMTVLYAWGCTARSAAAGYVYAGDEDDDDSAVCLGVHGTQCSRWLRSAAAGYVYAGDEDDDDSVVDGAVRYLRCGESKYDVFLADFLLTALLLHTTLYTPNIRSFTALTPAPTQTHINTQTDRQTDRQRGNMH